MPDDDTIAVSHEAEQSLRRDIKRDAARTRAADTYDAREHTQQEAQAAEEQIDPTRHRDAY